MLIGSWLCSTSPAVAELMAICGYDFLTIDVEHSPVDIEGVYRMLQAIKSGNPNCKALVRLAGNSYSETKRYLDAGADGVICPLVNSRRDAELLVESVKYAPLGRRGVGYCRANAYGLDLQNSFANANGETLVVVQIEDVMAINNLDEILSVSGIDAAIIGPYDLSSSMGLTGNFSHPKMVDAIQQTLEACNRHNVLPGIHVVEPNPSDVQFRIEQGYRFIAYSVDITMISKLSLEFIEKFKHNE